jgi:hypothetical protein
MSATPRFCSECGTPLTPGVRFCSKCGHPTDAPDAAGGSVYPPAQPPPMPGPAAPYGGPPPGGWTGAYLSQPAQASGGGSGALYAILGAVMVLAIAAIAAGGWYFFLRPQAPTTSAGTPTVLVASAATPLVAAATTPTQAATSTIPPSPTTQPTVTPVPPTSTPVPPSATPAPPTATAVPATATRSPATATARPPTPSPGGPLPAGVQLGPVLATLDFQQGPGAFASQVDETQNSRWFHQDGLWHISIKTGKRTAWNSADATCADCIAETSAVAVAGGDENGFGMMVRFQDQENYYSFRIDDQGQYSFQKTEKGETNYLVKWTSSDALKTGRNQPNILRVVAVGPKLSLYANGRLLQTVTDGTFKEGKVSLVATNFADTGSFEAAFQKLQIWQAK